MNSRGAHKIWIEQLSDTLNARAREDGTWGRRRRQVLPSERFSEASASDVIDHPTHGLPMPFRSIRRWNAACRVNSAAIRRVDMPAVTLRRTLSDSTTRGRARGN
jgi:hypothetical protein